MQVTRLSYARSACISTRQCNLQDILKNLVEAVRGLTEVGVLFLGTENLAPSGTNLKTPLVNRGLQHSRVGGQDSGPR